MTNATTGAQIAQPGQEPLGTLLVKRGLITDEQLADALAQQQASGEPLGKIVVERGYVRPEVVAQALATQHGGLLKTEYGFATGFGARSASDEPVPEPPVSAGAPAALRTELAHASEDSARLREENERLALRRAELEQRLASEAQRSAALERELAARPAEGESAEPGELEKQIAKEVRKVSALEAAVAVRDTAIAEFKETAESWQRALAERDDAIRTLVAARDEALAELAARASAIEALEAAVESAAPAPVDTSELDELRAELERSAEALADAERARDKALEQIAEVEAARGETLAQLRAAKAELAERDARVAELAAGRDAALEQLHGAQVAIAGRESAIAELVEKLADATAPKPERWADAEQHALFFRGAEGYELVERSGPPPAAGEVVSVPGGPRVVARIAAGPGTTLPCAYLLG